MDSAGRRSPLMLAAWIFVKVPESSRWLSREQTSRVKEPPMIMIFQPPLLYRTLLGIGLGAIPVIGTAANANYGSCHGLISSSGLRKEESTGVCSDSQRFHQRP
ncbi:MAG: hypothetical protein U0936_11300 [Planctomycetaceae bacterium]